MRRPVPPLRSTSATSVLLDCRIRAYRWGRRCLDSRCQHQWNTSLDRCRSIDSPPICAPERSAVERREIWLWSRSVRACTVQLDGKAVFSCLTPVAALNGRRVRTVEGLGTINKPGALQRDFFASNLSNLRAALDWCFSDHGGNALGARLSGASASLFFQAGFLPEYVTWTERAVGVLDPAGARFHINIVQDSAQGLSAISLLSHGIQTNTRIATG
jgi:hypothetical protein